MTNKVILFIFIEIFTNFWASVFTMSISESINKCAELRQRCNPNSQQPCCNPNEVCVNKLRDQLDTFNFICLKKGVLDNSCKRSLDCEAIIGAKCSENGHCVCKKQTAEYNETICLHYSSTNRLIDELMDNHYYFNEVYYLKNNYSSKTGCQRVSNTNYGESCSTDLQCLENNHKNLKCINRECRCPNGTQFILDLLACKSSLRGVGKSCLINRKCLVENSYCNRFGICKCKNNYYYTAADKCELLQSRYNCSRSNANSLTDNKTFYKPAQKPNDPCFSNTDCKNVKYTSCQLKVCKCLKNFYISEKTGNCTRYAKQPNGRCIEERGCWRVDNSNCKLGKCQCKDNFPFNPSTKKCELILSRKCSQNSDCDELKNIICSKGKCVCNVNYFEKNGTCIVGINGFCNELEECFVEHTICEDNKCQCTTNFYASKNESFCIPKAKSLYDYCEKDEGCQALANAVCIDNKCKCKSTFIDKEGKCRPLDYCETKSDCKKPKYSICRNHKCVCSSNKYLSSNNAKCISYAKNIGSSCENGKRCERLKNTKCNEEKKCACIEDYYEIDNQCKGLIDAKCSENSDCADNNSICEFNKCQCLQNFYSSADKKECRKYANHVNEPCEENDDCVKVKNSKCSEHDKCVCKRDYFEKEGECKALLGVNCTKDSECGSNNARCESSRCVCSAGFFPSPNKEECIKYATSLNDYCESNNYCKNIKYTYCMDNKCVCVSNYIEMDGKCKGLFGESCLEDTDCIVNNSKCEENICQCPVDYYVSENKDRCYRYAEELTTFCESNIGCKNLKFTVCSKNKQCVCLPNYVAIEEICRGLIGSNCSEDEDCAIDESICKSEICQCGVSFYLSKHKDKCYPYAGEIDSFCESSIGCRDLNYTLCSENNTCACLENYTVVDGYCRGLIEAKCFNDLDCAVENSVCKAGLCQCPTDFYLSTNKTKCYPYARELGGFCESSIGCRDLKYTDCVGKNQCDCLPNYTVIEGHCKALIGSNCSEDFDCIVERSVCKLNICQCSDDEYLSANRERCYPYAKNLNDFCEDNAGCRDLKYSQCVENNKCVCLDHYIQVDDYCRGLIEANCSNNSDCAVDHSYCDESDTCRCFDNFYQSENRGECYSLAQKIGDFCETNIGCRELEFTDCFENKCVCLSNYTEVDDRCRGVINAKCFKDSDCATKNSVCEANTCRCSVGFYLSTDRTQCHPLAKQINDFCETEFGCRDLRFTNCSTDKKCVCLQNYTKIDDSCRGFIHENCFDASDCAAKNSICKSNTCQCPDDFYLSADERKCHPFAKEINDFCETDFACHDLKFTSCSALNKCTCLPTHIVINGHCRGLINAKCFKYSDCATENSVCESSTCQCSDDFYLSLDEKRCYQFAKHVNDFCETHISCRNLKFTSCSQNNKCTCLSTHLEINRHCRGVMGSSCFENDDCAAINAICDKSKTCQCPPELYRSRTELECYPFANRYNDFCEIDIGCRNLKYTHCSEDYRCICSQNYTEIDGRCSGLINASCSEDPDCAIANSICSESNTCQCLNDFYLSSSKETCIHYAEKIHDFCEDDSSCRNVPFTYCSVNNKCACLPNYSQIDDNCRAPINESCSNNSQCSAENSICESNICQCGVDFYLSENQDKCHPYAQQLENSCETELGCRNLKYTYCSEHGCVCIKNYIVVNGHCRGLISVKCSDDSDCAVGYSYCDESNTCQCPADHYLLVEEDKCYPYAKQLHDFCENDDSCYNLNFSTCFENKCICPANYTAIDGNCRGFNGAQCYGSSDCVARNSICQSSFCQCPQDFYLSESQKECYQYAKNLHDFCENDIGCYNLNFSICFENKCICPANYTVIDGNCRGFNGAKCYKNSDCVAGNSICELSFCQCPQNSYLSENRKECYQYAKNLHDFCETDENCYDINFSYCYEGKCSCIINYVEINGSCLGLIDSKCSDYSECAAENSICNREACQCSTNFYPSVNNDTCYKYAEKLGDVCEMNAGCRNLNFTFCSEDYQCICSESYIVVNESCRGLNEAKCNENLDCAAKNSICDQSSTCQCPIDRYLSADKRKCYSYARQLSDFCEYDGGCRELNFTKCSESQRCSCAEGYLDIDGRCKGSPLIRANCFEDSDCAVEKSICHLGNCQCPNDYYLSENGNKCYLYAKQLNTFCETDLSCRDFKYSYCSENNICACLENYTVVDGYCRGLIEAKCFNDLDCAVENSVCKAGLCQCPTDFYLSTNKTKCYPYARELGDFCESSIGCRDLKYTDCVGKNQCDCLPNYTVIEGHCKALIGSNCSEDFDCVVERSVCKLNICQCSDDEYLSANRERCYPYAKNLNDFCEDNAGCRDLKYSQCVENNKCVCLDHYIQVDDYCRGLIEANCSNNSDCAVDHSYCDESDTCRCFDNFYQSENRGECYSLAQKIGDFCETNIGCRELEFTDCFENKCVCLSNYTEVDDRCRGVINAKCFKDSDCATKNSVCEANTCRCSVGFYLSTDRTQCHPLAKQINDFCETEFGCRDLRFTNCSTDKKCVCLQNYTEIDDSCRGFIHAKCFEASDCAAENSICKSNTCQCPDDFNLSSDERKCHPFAKEMHDFCDTDLSCRDLRFTFCSENNKCTCLPNYTIVNEHCRGLIGSKCFNDSDCALTNSVCHSNACQCRTGFYASESKNNCHRYAKQFGAFCENDNACRNILYTHCSKDNRCVCNTSYVLIDNHCQGFIGANCSKDSDCAFEYSFCDKKICKCRDDFYLSINGQRCYAYAERINEFCDSDMGCRYLNYSFCSKNNKCVCVPNYTPVDELCRGLNGAECSKDLDCALNNSACKDNTCQCLPDFYLSKTEEKCYQYAKQLNDFCETDDACRDLKFTHCFENKCTCLPNYEAINGHCRGLVGSKCSETSDCLLNFSTCKFNECQCSDEFYFSPSSQKCISFAKNLNDFCETDDTCRNIKFSYCNKNKQCTCLPNYIGENDYCRGLIDENCIKDSDCAVENSICSSNVCQCSVDHYPSTNKENCFKYASNIDDYCEDNEGCRKIKHSFCSNNKNCTCFSPYKENEGKCLGVFNASCYDDSDCDSFYQCSSNRCLCRDGFTFDDYYKCISVNRYLGESCIDNDYCRGIEHSSCDSDFRCTCATNYFNVNGSCLHYMGTCCLKDSNCGIKNSVCERYHCQCKKNYFFHPFYLECQKK